MLNVENISSDSEAPNTLVDQKGHSPFSKFMLYLIKSVINNSLKLTPTDHL